MEADDDMSRNLSPIEAARIKVAMLERDVELQERYMKFYQDKLDNIKEDLGIARRVLEELEKVEV